MWGKATFATEVSRTSMKVASITEAAISHGLKLGTHSRGANAVAVDGRAFGLSFSAVVLIESLVEGAYREKRRRPFIGSPHFNYEKRGCAPLCRRTAKSFELHLRHSRHSRCQ